MLFSDEFMQHIISTYSGSYPWLGQWTFKNMNKTK